VARRHRQAADSSRPRYDDGMVVPSPSGGVGSPADFVQPDRPCFGAVMLRGRER